MLNSITIITIFAPLIPASLAWLRSDVTQQVFTLPRPVNDRLDASRRDLTADAK
jgi:hypothetical protein